MFATRFIVFSNDFGNVGKCYDFGSSCANASKISLSLHMDCSCISSKVPNELVSV